MKNYWEPTPLKFRRLGDALLAASMTTVTFAIANDYKAIAITACIIGTLGKFLSNFFTESPEEPTKKLLTEDDHFEHSDESNH